MSHEVDELQIGEKVGYRVFTLQGGLLYGLSVQDFPLEPGGSQAVCSAGHGPKKVLRNTPDGGVEMVEVPWHGPVPSKDCGCGFWAYKTEGGARHRLQAYMGRGNSPFGHRLSSSNGFGDFGEDDLDGGVLFAEVKLWGRIVQGRDGYRAEYCKLSALYDTKGVSSEALEKCAEYYDVPIVQAAADADDPDVVKNVVIEEIHKGRQGRSGRSGPATVKTNEGNTYKVWMSDLRKRKNPTALWDALVEAKADARKVSFKVKRNYSHYGDDLFIIGLTKSTAPASEDSEETG